MSDLSLEFDIKPFQNAMDGMTKVFNEFNNKVRAMSEKRAKETEAKTADSAKSIKKQTESALDDLFPSAKKVKKEADNIKVQYGKSIKEATGKISKESDKAAGNMERRFSKTGKRLGDLTFTNLLAKIGVVSLAVSGVRKVLSKLPEVGRSFQIAGDIISRNLLWPLRKMLIPALQNMLRWVRDNRAMFVRWGGILVNIFKTLQTAVSGFIKLLKSLFRGFYNSIRNMVGTSAKSIQDLINLALFKIAFVFTFLSVALELAFEKIGKIIGNIVVAIVKLAKGFFSRSRFMISSINDVVDILSELLDMLGFVNDESNSLGKTFEWIGGLLADSLLVPLKIIIQTLDAVIQGFRTLGYAAKYLIASVKGDAKEQAKILREEEASRLRYRTRTAKREAEVKEIITPYVKGVRKTFGLKTGEPGEGIPEELLKTPGGLIMKEKTLSKVDNRKYDNRINIIVNESTKPLETAITIRKQIKDQRIKAGY